MEYSDDPFRDDPDVQYVTHLLGPEKANQWWKCPNPLFGGKSPFEMILWGHVAKVRKFINDARAANQLSAEQK